MGIKVIFLDLDGVLVTRRIGVMEEPLLRNLKKLVDLTKAQIVLSSDWRRHPQARAEAQRMLSMVGLSFFACTPCLSAYVAQRPTEIMQYKRDHNKQVEEDRRIVQWVAIDDRMLLEERHGNHLQGHFVQTHPMRGLQDREVEECAKILNSDPPPPKVPAAVADALDQSAGSGQTSMALRMKGGPGFHRGASTGPLRQSAGNGAAYGRAANGLGMSSTGGVAATYGARTRGRSAAAASLPVSPAVRR
eukprot:TRINITY_DN45591_c0_g1_i1.p1 TRINITY_DN45591_c0_g1~~TRINITY_DN45591_c0_g1_i1.p1  ORF type:complete len:247 (+),score=29.63 TRINITY_DN45591_c0_g1_i1:251-991(+)